MKAKTTLSAIGGWQSFLFCVGMYFVALFFSIFVIAIAAAEAAVVIAIIINLYRSHQSIDVGNAEEMKF